MPTVTDADVVLGLIDPDGLRGRHDQRSSPSARAQALAQHVGEPLGLSPETAAYAVHEMVCENMASAARVHAVERGAVIGDHTLIAFGGAAPLHAARVAEKIGVDARASCRRTPASARRSDSSPRRSPTSSCAAATCGSMRSMPQAPPTLLAEMAAEARALVAPGARGAPVSERRSRLHALRRPGSRDHRDRCRRAILRRTTSRRCARPSRRTTRRCSRGRSPAPRSRC